MPLDQLEGRNPVVECLARGRRRVHRVWLDQGAKPDPRIQRILVLCEAACVPVDRVERRRLDKMADGRVHNGVVAHADPLQRWTSAALLDDVFARGQEPFFVLADGLQYEHNLGAVLRSALGFGASAVVVPTRRGADPTSPVVQRVAMGAVEEVPVVQESLFVTASTLRKAGVPLVGADAAGTPSRRPICAARSRWCSARRAAACRPGCASAATRSSRSRCSAGSSR
ncbi:MAG: RNA methyltransferase [Myxococcota bacterium]